MRWGCATAGAGAGFIAGGAAYDSLLVESGRDPVFVPFMAKTYNSVFGEGPNKKIPPYTGNNALSETEISKNKESVTEVINKYNQMSPKEKSEFIAEIKKENDSHEIKKENASHEIKKDSEKDSAEKNN